MSAHVVTRPPFSDTVERGDPEGPESDARVDASSQTLARHVTQVNTGTWN